MSVALVLSLMLLNESRAGLAVSIFDFSATRGIPLLSKEHSQLMLQESIEGAVQSGKKNFSFAAFQQLYSLIEAHGLSLGSETNPLRAARAGAMAGAGSILVGTIHELDREVSTVPFGHIEALIGRYWMKVDYKLIDTATTQVLIARKVNVTAKIESINPNESVAVLAVRELSDQLADLIRTDATSVGREGFSNEYKALSRSLEQGNYGKAATQLTILSNREPMGYYEGLLARNLSAAIDMARGNVLTARNQWTAILEECQEALSDNPARSFERFFLHRTRAVVQYNLAELYAHSNDFESAKELMSNALSSELESVALEEDLLAQILGREWAWRDLMRHGRHREEVRLRITRELEDWIGLVEGENPPDMASFTRFIQAHGQRPSGRFVNRWSLESRRGNLGSKRSVHTLYPELRFEVEMQPGRETVLEAVLTESPDEAGSNDYGNVSINGRVQIGSPILETDIELIDVVITAPGFSIRGENENGIHQIGRSGTVTPAFFFLTPNGVSGRRAEKATIWVTWFHHGVPMRYQRIEIDIITAWRPTPPGKSMKKKRGSKVSRGDPITPVENDSAAADMNVTFYADPEGEKGEKKIIIHMSSTALRPDMLEHSIPPNVQAWLEEEIAELRRSDVSRQRVPKLDLRAMRGRPNLGKRLRTLEIRAFGDKLTNRVVFSGFLEYMERIEEQARMPISSIAIYSDDHSIPWELMRIETPDRQKVFLGNAFRIGRFPLSQPKSKKSAPPSRLEWNELVLCAPRYSGIMSLAHRDREIAHMEDVPGFQKLGDDINGLIDFFQRARDGNLLHFSGHALWNEKRKGQSEQGLRFEDELLMRSQLEALINDGPNLFFLSMHVIRVAAPRFGNTRMAWLRL